MQIRPNANFKVLGDFGGIDTPSPGCSDGGVEISHTVGGNAFARGLFIVDGAKC